ncbi:MAG: hypothetical protein MJ252_01655 [archaeon]|nr:hypothetical protein [archaeon]
MILLVKYFILFFLVTYEFTKKIIAETNQSKFKDFLDMLTEPLKSKASNIKSNSPYLDVSILQNYLIFFMTVTLNLKDQNEYVTTIFNGKKQYFKFIKDIILKLPELHKKLFLGIISYIFQKEYLSLYFNKNEKKLEEIFMNEYQKFSELYTGSLRNFNKQTYIAMYERLLKFDFAYDYFFQNSQKTLAEDANSYKLCIAQSVIRVVFSKEKTVLVPSEKFYEFKFLSTIIDEDLKDTQQRFGDDLKALFVKDDLCDDIIKYMFFIFGNSMLIECFVKPINDLREKEKKSKRKLVIGLPEYEFVMNTLIDKINSSIPLVLKILLKLVYVYVKKYFTSEEICYSALITLLFFNFILSPRVQFIYDISEDKIGFLKDLNILVRNTCYNNQFNPIDPLSAFNEKIKEYNTMLKEFIEENILSIDMDDENIQMSLSELFTEKYLIYPKFLFYLDSMLICNAAKGGLDKLIEFSQIKE